MKLSENLNDGIDLTSSKAPFFIKFGFICMTKESIPQWFGVLALIISYLQILSLYFTAAYRHFGLDDFELSRVGINFYKLFNVVDFFDFTQSGVWVNLAIRILISVYSTALFLHTVVFSVKLIAKKPINRMMTKFWGWICYAHPLIVFYPIHNIAIKNIQLYHDGLKLPDYNEIANVVISYVTAGFNSLLAIFLSTILLPVVKSKDILSIKSVDYKRSEIFQKIVIPILLLGLNQSRGWLIYPICFSQILSAFYRQYIFFKRLPYYSSLVMKIAAVFDGIICSFSLSLLITKIASEFNQNIKVIFFFIVALLLIPFIIKAQLSHLSARYQYCIACDDLNVYEAVTKRSVTKHLLKNKDVITSYTNKINRYELLYQGKFNEYPISIQNKDDLNKFQKNYISKTIEKYPESNLLKLFLASSYIKYNGFFLQAFNLLEQIRTGRHSIPELLSVYILIYKLERILLIQYKESTVNNSSNINMLKYIRMSELGHSLRLKILKQNNMQVNFWNQWLQTEPCYKTLYTISNKIHYRKKKILRYWKRISPQLDKHCTQPILTYGLYVSILNNDIAEGDRIIEEYKRVVNKSLIQFDFSDLNDSTLLDPKNFHIKMYGTPQKIGIIMDCSSQVQKSLGYSREELIEGPVKTIMPRFFADRHDVFLNNHYATGQNRLINNTRVMPVQKKDNYIDGFYFHLKVNPLVEEGLSYICLFRGLVSSHMFCLLDERATIQGVDQKFAKRFGLESRQDDPNVCFKEILLNLWFVNEILNIKIFEREQPSRKYIPKTMKQYKQEEQELYGGGGGNSPFSNNQFQGKFYSSNNNNNNTNALSANRSYLDSSAEMQNAKNENEIAIVNQGSSRKERGGGGGRLSQSFYTDLSTDRALLSARSQAPHFPKNGTLSSFNASQSNPSFLKTGEHNNALNGTANGSNNMKMCLLAKNIDQDDDEELRDICIAKLTADDILKFLEEGKKIPQDSSIFENKDLIDSVWEKIGNNKNFNMCYWVPKSYIKIPNGIKYNNPQYYDKLTLQVEVDGRVYNENDILKFFGCVHINNTNIGGDSNNKREDETPPGQRKRKVTIHNEEENESISENELDSSIGVIKVRRKTVVNLDQQQIAKRFNFDLPTEEQKVSLENISPTQQRDQNGQLSPSPHNNDHTFGEVSSAVQSFSSNPERSQFSNQDIENYNFNHNSVDQEKFMMGKFKQLTQSDELGQFGEENFEGIPHFTDNMSPPNFDSDTPYNNQNEENQRITLNYGSLIPKLNVNTPQDTNSKGKQLLLKEIIHHMKKDKLQEIKEKFLARNQNNGDMANFVKEKLRRRLVINHINVNAMTSTSSSLNSRTLRIETTINSAISLKTQRRWMKVFACLVTTMIITIITLIFSQTIIAFEQVKKVEDHGAAITQNWNLIDSSLVDLVNTIIWTQLLSGFYTIQNGFSNANTIGVGWRALNIAIRDSYLRERKRLIQDYQNFSLILAETEPHLQKLFFEDQIRMYDIDFNTQTRKFSTIPKANDSYMGSSQQNIDSSLKSAQFPIPSIFSSTVFNPDLQKVIINTKDDFLVKGYKNAFKMQDYILDSIEGVKRVFLSVQVTVGILFGLLFFVLFAYISKLDSEAQDFMYIYLKFEEKSIKQNLGTVLDFQRGLKQNLEGEAFVQSINFDAPNSQNRQNGQKRVATNSGSNKKNNDQGDITEAYNANQRTSSKKKPKMSRMYRYHKWIMVRFLPFIFIGFGQSLNLYFTVDSNQGKLQRGLIKNIRALEKLSLEGSLVAQLTLAITFQSQLTYKNEEINSYLTQSLKEYSEIKALREGFMEPNGQLLPENEEIFQNYSCSKFSDLKAKNDRDSSDIKDAIEECPNYASNQGTVSLVNITSQIHQYLQQTFEDYLKDPNTAKDVLTIFTITGRLNNLSRGLLIALTTLNSNIFNDALDQQTKFARWVGITVVLVSIFIYIGIYFFAIKKVLKQEDSRKRMIKLVPTQLVLGNTFMKHYLVQHSNGMLETIRHLI